MDELLSALPIRDIRVRYGTYGNCAGVALALVDFEPGTANGVEVVDATDPDDADLNETGQFCVEHIGIGVRAAFRARFGAEPAVRVVVRRVHANPVDANENVNQQAGRLVVEEAARLTGS